MARRQIPCTVKRRRGLLIAVPARKNREPKRRTSPNVWLLGKEAPVGPPWTDTSSGDGRGRPTRSFTTADMGTSRAARESQAASLGQPLVAGEDGHDGGSQGEAQGAQEPDSPKKPECPLRPSPHRCPLSLCPLCHRPWALTREGWSIIDRARGP